MTISDKIKTINFLSTREVLDTTDNSGIGMIGYKHDDEDLYSSIVASPASTSGVIPHVVMISTMGALIKYDSGDNTISVVLCSKLDKSGFTETFPSSIDEGEFFQCSLINDFRHVTYEHIIAVRDVMEFLIEKSE